MESICSPGRHGWTCRHGAPASWPTCDPPVDLIWQFLHKLQVFCCCSYCILLLFGCMITEHVITDHEIIDQGAAFHPQSCKANILPHMPLPPRRRHAEQLHPSVGSHLALRGPEAPPPVCHTVVAGNVRYGPLHRCTRCSLGDPKRMPAPGGPPLNGTSTLNPRTGCLNMPQHPGCPISTMHVNHVRVTGEDEEEGLLATDVKASLTA